LNYKYEKKNNGRYVSNLIHHGHIRLIKKAKKYGDLIIGLTTDKQIKKFKGYFPELNYKFRKEILNEIKVLKKLYHLIGLLHKSF
jgi:glycerol-3-phosphate cytidylyltransferase